MTFWLILALAVLPFLHSSFEFAPIESAHTLGLIVLGVSIAGAKVFRKNKALGVGVFCVLASYFIGIGTPLVRESFQVLVFFLIWLMFYFAALEAKKKPLLIAIAVAGTINALYLLCQTIGFDPVFSHLTPIYPIFGFLGSSGNSGVFQAICLPIAISIHPILGMCVLAGLLLAKSTVAMVAGIAGACFCLKRKHRRKLILVPVVLVALIIFIDRPTKADFLNRFANIKHTFRFIDKGEMRAYRVEPGESGKLAISTYSIKYTDFGYGLGSFKVTVPFVPEKDVGYEFNYQGAKSRHPHNEPAFVLYECGPIAVAVLIWIILSALFKDTNRVIRGSILATTICGLGYFPFLIPAVTIQIAVLLGLNDGGRND